ncbi:MAG: GYDIA family GHMP kinase [Saprospiraceae bacterium]
MKSAFLFETHAQGKLLLTGEYFVLDGATALAMPVRFGQSLRAEEFGEAGRLAWVSKNPDGTAWFEAEFELPSLRALQFSDEKTAETLSAILLACQTQRPHFFLENQSLRVATQNDFPREWGLGTSSSLIAALARWADADPYKILSDTLGGSGYDIACAYADGPILFHLEGQTPKIAPALFAPSFSPQLYFVFLGKKQDSRAGIARYRERALKNPETVFETTRLTHRFLNAKTLAEFEAVLLAHELLVAEAIGLPRAKDLYFHDFWGEVKSLGAWGGDFVLATSERPEDETRLYFKQKEFEVFLPWREMKT